MIGRLSLTLAGALAVAGCADQALYVTSLGPLRISDDPDMALFVPQDLPSGFASGIGPIEGGLIARDLAGRPVPFEARDAAQEAMEAHCLDQHDPGAPHFFGWRDLGYTFAWTAAGCVAVTAGRTASAVAE